MAGILAVIANDFTSHGFNWLLLIVCIVTVLVASFFLFYWNRLLGWILAFVIRLLLWDKNNVWVECESAQISVLAGRVLLKDLRYHSRNQSVRFLTCHIAWRYWLWRTRTEHDIAQILAGGEGIAPTKAMLLPCRIHLHVEGLEWFIYNRTQAYDDILAQVGHPPPNTQESPFMSESTATAKRVSTDTEGTRTHAPHSYPPSTIPSFSRLTRTYTAAASWVCARFPSFELRDILPIGIDVAKGALALGNDSTPSIFIVDFAKAAGTYSITDSRSSCDFYKQVFSFAFQNTKVITRSNLDYRGSMFDRGKTVFNELQKREQEELHAPPENYLSSNAFRRLAAFLPTFPKSTVLGEAERSTWKGLERYRTAAEKVADNEEPEQEYAKLTTLLETPFLQVAYYSDYAGTVPVDPPDTGMAGLETIDIGNGDLSPQWGVDLVLDGGVINYGPWADRQRDALQRFLFPSTFHSGTPTERLQPGQTRLHVALKIFLELQKPLIMRIPTREASKNWRYDGMGDLDASKRDKRPFGWLDITIGANSTLNYVMPMVANEDGYDNILELHLDQVGISSSVNQTEFLSSQSCRVLCEMPAPLNWCAARQWTFDVSLEHPVIYLLRDHVNLIQDLIRDWTSGPPTAHAHFIPMTYIFNLALKEYRLHLYVSDHNVVDLPLSKDHNAFLIATGSSVSSKVTVPSTKFRPESSTIAFQVDLPDPKLSFATPAWNVRRSFATPRTDELGRIGPVRLEGSYLSHAAVREENVDLLKIDISIEHIALKAFGWAIRHLMLVVDNYFGNFTNFTTRPEYLEKKAKGAVGDPVEQKYREGKSNVFEVLLVLDVQETNLVLPKEIHDCQSAVLVCTSEIQVLLRLHDYSMEMSLNTQPLHISAIEDCSTFLTSRLPPGYGQRSGFFIDSLDIVANRLFGPQPRTSTYLCLWEIQVGAMHGLLSPDLANSLAASGRAFELNYTDLPNAPSEEFHLPSNPDVTFLKFSLASVDLNCRTTTVAAHVELPRGLRLDMNNLAGHHYQKVTTLQLPLCTIRCLHSTTIGGKQRWLEILSASFDGRSDIYSSPYGWREAARSQMEFVAAQDELTQRVPFMYEPYPRPWQAEGSHRNNLFLPHPKLSNPVQSAVRETASLASSLEESLISDEEELSATDWDARVASSRPTSPLILRRTPHSHTPFTDGSISSGDESDDDDIIESESSYTSEGSDLEQPESNFTGSVKQLYPYHRVLRGYLLVANREDGDPFVIDKAGRSGLDKGKYPAEPTPTGEVLEFLPTTPMPFQSDNSEAEQDGGTENKTIIRFESRSTAKVLITPFCPTALEQLQESFDNASSTAEQYVDDFLSKLLASIPCSTKKPQETLVLDLHLPSIHLCTWQDIMSQDAAHAFELESTVFSSPKPFPPRSRLLSHIDLRLESLRAHGFTSTSNAGHNFTIRFNRLAGGLMSTSSYVTRLYPVLDFAVQKTSASWSFSSKSSLMDIGFGDAHVKLDDSSPEVVMGTLQAFERIADSLARAAKKPQERWRSRMSMILWAALRQEGPYFEDADPLSWTQVSFMVTSGTPQRMRSNKSWQLLSALRRCLRRLPDSELRELLSSTIHTVPFQAPPTPSDLLSLIRKRCGDLIEDLDDASILALPLFTSLFPDQSQEEAESQNPAYSNRVPLSTVKLTTGAFTFTLQGEEDPQSELVLGPINLTLNAVTRQLSGRDESIPNESRASITPADGPDQSILHFVLSGSIGQVYLSVYPTSNPFMRHVLRVIRQSNTSPPQTKGSLEHKPSGAKRTNTIMVETFIDADLIGVKVAAQKILFDAQLSGIRIIGTGTDLVGGASSLSGSGSLTARELSLQARVPRTEKVMNPEREVLAAIIAAGISVYGGFDGTHSRCLASLADLQLHVPRSAIKLYHFVEEWRAEYVPIYNTMFQGLLSEIEKRPKLQSPPAAARTASRGTIDIQVSLASLGMTLQVMHGTWLSWQFLNTVAFMHSSTPNVQNSPLHFGTQFASQVITLSNTADTHDATSLKEATAVKLELPSLTVSGHYEDARVECSVTVDFLSLKLKPQFVDDILAVQQKFGSDFNDLLDIVGKTTRQRRISISSAKTTPKETGTSLPYQVLVKLRGFKIGIEGPSSTQYLDSSVMEATVFSGPSQSGVSWQAAISNLALSLAHHSAPRSTQRDFDRKYRSAYMVLDVNVDNYRRTLTDNSEQLNIEVNKIHAVLQAAAIGELGDLIDHVQAEMLLRKEQRAHELEEIKQKTQRVMQTLEFPDQPTESKSWLENRVVSVEIHSVGIAFPLSLSDDFMLARSVDNLENVLLPSSVPAFLITVHSIRFISQRNETGAATMKDFAFQFVRRFDQSIPGHFELIGHKTRNRMHFPEISAEIQSEMSSSHRRIWLRGSVNGFIFDLDPSIALYVFALVDVYRRGKDRIQSWASVSREGTPSLGNLVSETSPLIDAKYSELPTSSLRLSFEFRSGTLCLHPPLPETPSHMARESSTRTQSLPTPILIKTFNFDAPDEATDPGDVFHLPHVSLWGEFRGTPASQKRSISEDPIVSTLALNAAIHSSENTIKPSLLPFIAELTRSVEGRLEQSSPSVETFHRRAHTPTSSTPDHASLAEEYTPPPAISSMRVTLGLRIDRSKLELTCLPDVNVVAGLHWESGGFVMTVSPGAREITFAGSVAGITASLQHGYLSEPCVRANAHNLAFSVTFAKVKTDSAALVNSMSVVVNTEVSTSVRFGRLQDVLCFKAVWLDQIPVFESVSRPTVPHTPHLLPPAPSSTHGDVTPKGPSQPFVIMVLVQLKQIDVEADLGQAITKLTLHVDSLVLRTCLTEVLSEVTMSTGPVSLIAVRAISGYARVPEFFFKTTRRRKNIHLAGGNAAELLDISIRSGELDVSIDHEEKNILLFHADPLDVSVRDDWAYVSPESPLGSRQVHLHFSVLGGDLVAVARIITIPELILTGGKVRALLRSQKEGAARESRAFRSIHFQKPSNPLSDVATAMLHSTLSKLKETETLEFVVVQHMNLRMAKIRVGVLAQRDTRMAQFDAIMVEGELKRNVQTDDSPANRDLRLALQSFNVRGVDGSLGKRLKIDGSSFTAKQWLDTLMVGAKDIFAMPQMVVAMQTTEDPEANQIDYIFHSTFPRPTERAGQHLIYIALDFNKYEQLIAMQNSFRFEMEKAQAEAAEMDRASRQSASVSRRASVSKRGTDPKETKEMREQPADTSLPIPEPNITITPVATQPPSPTMPSGDQQLSPSPSKKIVTIPDPANSHTPKLVTYNSVERVVETPKLQLLGEASPDFDTFKRWTNVGIKESLPIWVHEYATAPLEQIMKVLLEVYIKQLKPEERMVESLSGRSHTEEPEQ